jgi:hypothetical protein
MDPYLAVNSSKLSSACASSDCLLTLVLKLLPYATPNAGTTTAELETDEAAGTRRMV